MSQRLFDSIAHSARLIIDGVPQEPIEWNSAAVALVKQYRAEGHSVRVKLTLRY